MRGCSRLQPNVRCGRDKTRFVLGDAEPVQFNCDTCGDVCFCIPDVDCATSAKTRVVTSSPAVSGSAAGEETTGVAGANAGTDVLSDDEIILPMLGTLPECVNAEKRAEVEAVLRRNVNLFARHEYDVGGTDLVQYKLELRDPSARPVCEPLRRHPTAYLDLIDAEVDKLLNAGLITPCNSPWASNIVLVKRRSAPGTPPRLRITCDFRLLNSRLHRLGFPMPNSQLIFDSLQGHRHFTTLDFSNAYLSVKLHPETSHLTAFVTRRGMFKFLRLGAGLSSAPAIFNQLIQILFSDMLWCEVLAFLDDLTLPSRTIDDGIKLLAKVLDRLQGAGLKLKASKCKLLQTEVKVLGVIVSHGSLQEDPERAAVVKSLTFPRTKRELRSLLGFVNFSRAHHKNLSEIILPLTACLKKGGKVEETPQALQAFRRLQEIMSSPPVLAMFDPSAKHTLDCDASDYACGACLLQTGSDGVERVVAYMSKTFSDAERRYCTTRKELLAIIFALKHWRHYLIGREVLVRSDHSALQYLLTSKDLSPQWMRYLDFLSNFDLQIQYRPGCQQQLADFLSRWRPCEVATQSTCSQCRPKGSKVSRVVRRRGRPSRAGVATDDDRRSHEREDGGTMTETEVLIDRSPESELRELSGRRSSPGSEATATSSAPGTDCSEPINLGGRTRLSDENRWTRNGSTDRRLSSGPAVALHSHGRLEDMPIDQLEAGSVDRRGTGCGQVTGAVSRDCANDRSITPVTSRRVETRAQRQQRDNAADGRGATRTGRRSANAPRLPDIGLGADWTRETIIKNQGDDAAISEVRRGLAAGAVTSDATDSGDPDLQCYVKQWDSLTVIDGVVYRKFVDATGTVEHFQLLLPLSMRAAFLSMIHATALCHARAFNKNEAQVQLRAYWPTWKRDLRVFLAACRRCAEFHSGRLPRQGELRPSGGKLGAPGQVLSIDLTGPHPSSNGFKYCLTAIDCFSKYLYLVGLREKSASHVAQALVQLFLKHGFYAVIKSDNGGEFINSLQAELDELTGVTRLTTTPYTPRQNPVERVHRSINAMFAKVVSRHTDWSPWLSYIAFAYNSTVHKSTGFTPHFLHYGRELANSTDLLLANPTEEFTSHGEFASQMIERMAVAHQLAREELGRTALQAKRYYDARVRPQKFEAGDTVLVYYPRRRPRQYPKWQRLFSTEAVVLSRVNDITYIIQLTRTKQKRVVHVDKLKLWRRAAAATGSDNESAPVV
jgi:hypothetical protein